MRIKMISKSLRKCCIFNAMDGTDNDILWEDQTENKFDTDTADVYSVVMMTHKQAVQLINETESEEEFEGFQ